MAEPLDTAEDGPAMVKQMADETAADLQSKLEEYGRDAALGVAFGTLSGVVTFIAKTMGAKYLVDLLDDYAKPMRDLLEMHGGTGTETCQ